jgi:hypothetical protein
MKNIIRQILKEDRRQMYLDKIVQVMKNDFPLIKNMKLYGFHEQLSRDELNYVFSGIFGEPVKYYYGGNVPNIIEIYDENENEIYSENSYGKWIKYEYDSNGNETYKEYSDGTWVKREYDENGNEIYSEISNGDWEKREYDKNRNIIYSENSNGYWVKREYDENRNLIYYENSDGEIRDNR